MAYHQNRMPPKHPRAGKPHDLPDFGPHFGLIAVDGTLGTEGFGLHKRTVVDALPGVSLQRRTVGAKPLPGVVFAAAVEGDHTGDHLFFPVTLVGAGHQLTLPFSTE